MKAIQTTFPWDIAQLTKSNVAKLCRWLGTEAGAGQRLNTKVSYEDWLKWYTPLCARGVNAVNG